MDPSPPRISRWARVRKAAGGAVLACLIIVGFAGAPERASADLSPLPVGFSVFVPCAAGGTGEVVSLAGQLHVIVSVQERTATEWVATASINPRGVLGTGQTTGDTYRGVGHTGSTTVSLTTGQRTTQTNSFLLVAPGPDNNLVAHTTWHATVLPDGSVVGEVEAVWIECR